MPEETYPDNTWPMENIEDYFFNCWVAFGKGNEIKKQKQNQQKTQNNLD